MTEQPTPPAQPQNPAPDPHALRALLDQARELLGSNAVVPRRPRTVGQVIALYLEHNARRFTPRSLDERRRILNLFVTARGEIALTEAQPADLAFWVKAQKRWKSDWTKRMVTQTILASFNWAVRLGLIPRNPFTGVVCEEGEARRPITPGEFQSALRHADALFRRVLVFLMHSGCRPGEMAAVRWCDVNFDLGFILLARHKTRKKTRKPRLIPLTPVTEKLLRWLWRQRLARRPHAAVLQELVAGGPPTAAEFHRLADAAGVPRKDRYKLAREAGLVSWYDGRPGAPGAWRWGLGRPRFHYIITRADRPGYYGHVTFGGGRQVMRKLADDEDEAQQRMGAWLAELDAEAQAAEAQAAAEVAGELEEDGAAAADAALSDLVFVNTKGNPWNRCNLSIRWQKLRWRAGLPADCHLYGTRHAFGTQGVLNGANLKLLSQAMGHSSVATTERYYVHVNQEIAAMREAMRRATQRPGGPRES